MSQQINLPTIIITSVIGAVFAAIVGLLTWAIPGAHDEQVAVGKSLASLTQQVDGLSSGVADMRVELREWRQAVVTRPELNRLEASIGQTRDEQNRRIDELSRRIDARERERDGKR